MSYHFNVLTEPWIPVVDPSGNQQKLGILDTLERAHELREISDESPLVEYGLHRLLCVFLMDALRPEKGKHIKKLLGGGKFDMEKICAYVQTCQDEGTSFDLFDEERPFLQTPYREDWDRGKEKSVMYLDCRCPTGNNHVHFDHRGEKGILSFAETARLLPSFYLFITAMGAKGYPSSINNKPPFYTLIKGSNLFETLMNTLVPIDEIEMFDDPPVIWRAPKEVVPSEKVYRTSWLYGMLFPTRRVHLIPSEAGVEMLCLCPGTDFSAPENWTDPHVTYRYDTKERAPWRPNGKRAIWLNLNDLVDVEHRHAPRILELYAKRNPDKEIRLTLYGVGTDQGTYLDLYYRDFRFPAAMTKEGRAEVLAQCIGECETLATALDKAFACHGITKHMASEAVQSYYNLCEGKLWQFCEKVLSVEDLDGEQALKNWKLRLYEAGKQVLADATHRLNLTGKEWLEFYGKQEKLQKLLWKLKEEGENGSIF